MAVISRSRPRGAETVEAALPETVIHRGDILLAIGGYLWLTGGRYASTDNAYVQADMVGVSTDVAGTVAGGLLQGMELDHRPLVVGAPLRNLADQVDRCPKLLGGVEQLLVTDRCQPADL